MLLFSSGYKLNSPPRDLLHGKVATDYLLSKKLESWNLCKKGGDCIDFYSRPTKI